VAWKNRAASDNHRPRPENAILMRKNVKLLTKNEDAHPVTPILLPES